MKSEREVQRDTRDEFDNSLDVPLPPAEAWRAPGGYPAHRALHARCRAAIPVAFAGVMKVEEVNPATTRRASRRGAPTRNTGSQSRASETGRNP